jgi:hypothetical protein
MVERTKLLSSVTTYIVTKSFDPFDSYGIFLIFSNYFDKNVHLLLFESVLSKCRSSALNRRIKTINRNRFCGNQWHHNQKLHMHTLPLK